MLRIFVYGDPEDSAMHAATFEWLHQRRFSFRIVGVLRTADVALAPLLKRRLTKAEYCAPVFGTLIFHPSLLPRHRGPDAIKNAIASGEKYSGVTWFWCRETLDAGPICEQEVVDLPSDVTARAIYEHKMVPAGVRCLGRALMPILKGYTPRAIEQNEEAATYESRMGRKEGAIA